MNSNVDAQSIPPPETQHQAKPGQSNTIQPQPQPKVPVCLPLPKGAFTPVDNSAHPSKCTNNPGLYYQADFPYSIGTSYLPDCKFYAEQKYFAQFPPNAACSSISPSTEGTSSEPCFTDKKEKNKYSARRCRKRKKIYIESLEEEVNSLRNQIKVYRNIIEKYGISHMQTQIGQTTFSHNKIDVELKSDAHPLISADIRRNRVNQSFEAWRQSLFTTLNNYILWYPITNDKQDKFMRKAIKYTSVEEKAEQEYIYNQIVRYYQPVEFELKGDEWLEEGVGSKGCD
jgi:hypothetical protein